MMAKYLKRVPIVEFAKHMRATQGGVLVFNGVLVNDYQYGRNQFEELKEIMAADEVHETEGYLGWLNGITNAIKRGELVHFGAGAENEGE